MRQKTTFVAVYLCIAFLFVQWSGLHLHINIDGHSNALHVSHVHGIDLEDHGHGHDHNTDIDVSLFELSGNWFKQIQNVLIFTLTLILSVTTTILVWPPSFNNTLSQRHAYLRPVLRGPPITR